MLLRWLHKAFLLIISVSQNASDCGPSSAIFDRSVASNTADDGPRSETFCDKLHSTKTLYEQTPLPTATNVHEMTKGSLS